MTSRQPEHLIALAHAANAKAQYDRAAGLCEKALRLAPDLPEGWYNLGIALRGGGNAAKAVESLRKAASLAGHNADAQNSIGLELAEAGAHEDAVACLQRAIALAPGHAFAYSNLGIALHKLRRYREAIASFQQAIALQPHLAAVHTNLASTLNAQGRFAEAEVAARKAVELDSRSHEAWRALGDALYGSRNYAWASESWTRALQIRPDYPFLASDVLHARMKDCEWASLNARAQELSTAILKGQKVAHPFAVLCVDANPVVQRKAAEIFVADKYPARPELGPPGRRSAGGKIRIAYLSADYHNHATAYLAAGLFELHDRNRFEVIGLSFGPDVRDEMRGRLVSAFDQFHDVRNRSDRAIAQLCRDLGVDIAVDLKGFTTDSRCGIFAYRAAPLQVSYLGYPGTMGARYIDYIVADPIVIPPGSEPFYSEKVVYLPHSYQVNDSRRAVSDRIFSRTELGLPEGAFVYCCFNNSHKILPETFDRWMRILRAVDGSVLWLYESTAAACANLRGEAGVRGVDPLRLVFASHLPQAEHLARYRAADLCLDTLPYNAHTTASDALWVGVPVLTQTGACFASRVAASLLHALGMPELVTPTPDAYEAIAVDLARSPHKLAALKARVRTLAASAPLFDTARFCRDLEHAYAIMVARLDAGQRPDHIRVPAGGAGAHNDATVPPVASE